MTEKKLVKEKKVVTEKKLATEKKMDTKQGHWILAKVGKKVLRPGGLELTHIMIDNLAINKEDDVVEFAPGLGLTAALSCSKNPKSYTGVDLNEEAANIVKKNVNFERMKVVVANAAETGLEDGCASKVYGEAMLSMQGESQKRAIMHEAARLLRKGGLYGIHELGLHPDDIDNEKKKALELDMSKAIHVQVRPLTTSEWTVLFEKEGFKVIKVATNPMHLLEPKRMIQDEGFFRTIKIVFNILRNKEIRGRIKKMKSVFRKHADSLNAITIVAEKL